MSYDDEAPIGWPSFGDLLKRHRQERKLRQTDLAERASVSWHQIASWEQGHRGARIGIDTVLSLAGALQLSRIETDELLAAAGHNRYVMEVRWGRPLCMEEVINTRPELAERARKHMVNQYGLLREIPPDPVR
ncbi:MAG: helix-turn-helix transcriptional regulator [Acidimicrobiaceae bacterium]|nr:helix-turn-helix transcriptional regulator [Acidimicrobiaceae bacterium]